MKIFNKKSNTPPLTFLQRTTPLNLEAEKEKFLFDPKYNPQFQYQDPLSLEELQKYGAVQDTYLQLAENILSKVNNDFETEQDFFRVSSGDKLSTEKVNNEINKFLQTNQLTEIVDVEISANFNSRTSIRKSGQRYILQLRSPLNYREFALQGVLRHEIGTHLFRWLNDAKQPWNENKNQHGLSHNYQITEEGLASINSLSAKKIPYLWTQATLYLSVHQANQSSFSELNQYLKQYIDSPDLRWRYCVRAKRGVEDTSTKLVFSKSQMYLSGIIKVLSWLKKNNFAAERLMLGKIALEDLALAESMANPEELLLPDFITSQEYVHQIREIIKINKLDQYLS